MPDEPETPGFTALLDEFGMRFASRFSFNKTYTNASLAAVWAVISIAIAGPDAIFLVGVPRVLILVHLLLAFHVFQVILVGYYMAAEMYQGSSPAGGDGRGTGGEDEAAD